jgi:hypothetical protein
VEKDDEIKQHVSDLKQASKEVAKWAILGNSS